MLQPQSGNVLQQGSCNATSVYQLLVSCEVAACLSLYCRRICRKALDVHSSEWLCIIEKLLKKILQLHLSSQPKSCLQREGLSPHLC